MPRQGTTPRSPSAAGCHEPLDHDGERRAAPSTPGEHQREVARAHAQRGADLVAGGGDAEGEAEADEDQARQDVLERASALHRRHPAGEARPATGVRAGHWAMTPASSMIGRQSSICSAR